MNLEEKEIATLIMVKCGGIPKVITILAEKLSPNPSMYQLKYINDDFMVKLETNQAYFFGCIGTLMLAQIYSNHASSICQYSLYRPL